MMAQAIKRQRAEEQLKFDDSRSSNVLLNLHSGASEPPAGKCVKHFVHVEVLRKYSDFFSAQLSERWKGEDLTGNSSVSVDLKDCGDLQAYAGALKLLYRI
jgi:hypothetical protein